MLRRIPALCLAATALALGGCSDAEPAAPEPATGDLDRLPPDTGGWDPVGVRALLEWVDLEYPVDRTRIYLTGLSMGGYGTWSYLGRFGDEAEDPLAVAAAAPICGGGSVNQAAAMAATPIWAFHGTDDSTVLPAGSVDLVKAIGALAPTVAPRLTLYDGVGHGHGGRPLARDLPARPLHLVLLAPAMKPRGGDARHDNARSHPGGPPCADSFSPS